MADEQQPTIEERLRGLEQLVGRIVIKLENYGIVLKDEPEVGEDEAELDAEVKDGV